MTVKEDIAALVTQAQGLETAVPTALNAAYAKGLADSEADLAPGIADLKDALGNATASTEAGPTDAGNATGNTSGGNTSGGNATGNTTTGPGNVSIGASLTFGTDPLPNPSLGVPYSASLSTTGGTPPVTYALVGALPDGLSLDDAGNITGTPTTAGTFSFSVTATDAATNSTTETFSVTAS